MVMGVWDKDYFYLNTYCIDWKFTKFRTMKLSPAQGFLNVISRPHLIQVFPSKSPSWHIPPHLMPLYVYLDLASVLLYIHIYYRSKGFFHVLSFYENKVLVEYRISAVTTEPLVLQWQFFACVEFSSRSKFSVFFTSSLGQPFHR